MSGEPSFDPYAYAASQASPVSTEESQAFDPYAYAAAQPQNANYVPPTIGGGNTWKDAIEGIPQAIGAGIDRAAAAVAGIPADVANDTVNLGKSAVEAGYLAAGKLPPTWLDPTPARSVPMTDAWLVNEMRRRFGAGSVDVTGDPQSYLDQTLSAVAEHAPLALGAKGGAEEGAPALEEIARRNTPPEQSMGAAAATPRIVETSEPMRQAVVRAAQQNAGIVNPTALARHIQADTLPVPVRLTEGQALGDPVRISAEQNMRGAHPALAEHFNQQNAALGQNLQVLRDEVGPDVYSSNPVEHGDTLIKAYQDKASVANADIDAKYKALRDANGGQFPVDVKQLATNVEQVLHSDLLYEHAPKELQQLESLAKNGKMTFEQFEAMRTNLARTIRSSTNGNEKAAARVIRQQMEALPLAGGAQKLKPLADAARAAAKAQFDALGADPAYKAAVEEKVPPDRFVQKYVIGAPRNDVARMRENLAGNENAEQTIGVATIHHLRDAAGIKPDGSGNFSQAGFNRQRWALDPKLRLLVGPQTAEKIEQLGDVARYTQEQPRGSFVNNSNTFVSQAAEHGKKVLEHLINAKTGGIPIASMGRKALARRAADKYVRRVLSPGAGLTEIGP